MKTIKRIAIASIAGITLFSCNKNNNPCDGALKGEWVDYTGLDGCGWIIEVENGARLEVSSVNSHQYIDSLYAPYNGKKIWVTYDTLDGASICMVGIIPDILCIEDR